MIPASWGLWGYPPTTASATEQAFHLGRVVRVRLPPVVLTRATWHTNFNSMLFSATAFQAINTTRDNEAVSLDNRFTFSYELDANNKQARDLVVGTMLNRLFRYLALQQETGARFVNLSHPLLLQFKVGKTTLDLRDIEEQLQGRFKVGHQPHAKRRFAKRIVAVVDFLLEAPVQMTAEELISGLEDEMVRDCTLSGADFVREMEA